MNRQPVKSSFIAAIAYDAQNLLLEVELKSGKIYQYFEFRPEQFEALRQAQSLGKAYNQITRIFASRRATELEAPQGADPELK